MTTTFLDATRARRTQHQEGMDIHKQGYPANDVFFVEDGKAKITVRSEHGKEAILAILAPGDFFGEGCLIGQPLHLVTATAITECCVMRVGKAEMIQLLHDEPAFAELFMSNLVGRKSYFEQQLIDRIFNSSEKRLARILLLLANVGAHDQPKTLKVKVSQNTLAEMVGTTRSRINYFLNKFRKLGLIDYNGDLVVHASLMNILLRK